MRVSEWMSPDPVAVGPQDTVRHARQLLHRYGVRHLPVVDRGRVVGVLSDRDVRIDEAALRQLSSERLDESLGGARQVLEVMSAPPHLIRSDESMEAAARLMVSRRISALPVVDAEGELVGIVTTTDCLLASMRPASSTR
jgi:acetoin utilization protein AcuB